MAIRPHITGGQWITERAERSPKLAALSFEGKTWSYHDLVKDIDRLAGTLQAQGVKAGDRVAYLAFNHPMFLITVFAASKIGAVCVPLNFRLTGSELEYIINDAGIHLLIAGPEHCSVIEPVRAALNCKHFFAFDGAADGWGDIDAAMLAATPVAKAVEMAEDDVAILMYTSGTTGRPKGSMMTVGNVWWNIVAELYTMDLRSDDVHLTFAPLFHVGGFNILTLSTLLRGAHLILHHSFDPAKVLEDIPRYQVSTTFGVPAMLLFLSQHAGFATADMSTLRFIMVGGAPCPEGLLKLFNSRGILVIQGYGLTETAAMTSFLPPEWASPKLGSVGKPTLLTQMRLLDAEGAVIAAPHVKGEVCVRGMNVTAGYWSRPEATREAIDDEGWFRTGDIGYVDEDGFYFICDRVKDMVISGGENVYPAEVESVLYEHPSIAEVAVIGQPDEKWGETVVAVVALKPGTQLTLDELQAFASTRLARFKVPRHLRIVAALPRNPTGKIVKYRLREEMAT